MEVLIPIFVVLIVGLAIYGFYAAARRRKVLGAWARGKGLSFDASKDRGMDNRFAGFKCLRRGHSRYAYNIMRGRWAGRELLAFDYHYTTGSGKNRSDHYFSAVIVTAGLPLKPLLIRREGFFDKVTEFLGWDDIDFESAEFSRKFFVTSPDKRWAYDVIHQRMMDYLMSGPPCTVRFDSRHVIAHQSKRYSPAEFEAAAEFVCGMLDHLPDYLVKQQTQASG